MSMFLNLKDLSMVKQVDTVLKDVVLGKREFECPDITLELNGNPYAENEMESKFVKKAKVEIWRTMVGWSIVGYVAGRFLARGQSKQIMTITSFSTFLFGSSVGGTQASINTMRKQMDVDGSPIALETRYQVWRHKPDHEWLQKYQGDIRRWSYDSYSNEMIDDRDVRFNKRTIDTKLKQHDPKKRENFYRNRQRMDGNPSSFESDEKSFGTNTDNEMRWG